ncbi:MAG: LamG-like jellyroll fold domain-containing protein [Verrucomicrobiota bacterium]|jgi:uncharacterized protein YjdB
MKNRFLRFGFGRVARNQLIALILVFLGLPSLLSAQTLQHRYSFVSDASDSVGGPSWTGTLVPPNGGGAATINNGLILPGNANGGNGVSGYLSLPNGIVAGNTSLTVECWIQPSAVNTWAEIWDFGSSTAVNFALIQDSPGGFNAPYNMRVAFTPNNGEVDIDAPTYLPVTSSPQHIAVTYNNSTLTANLFFNGALDATTVLPNSTYSPGSFGGANGTTDNALGNDVWGDPQFGGTIYELRTWNGVVSQRYLSASALLGPSVLVTNLTVNSASLSASNMVLTGTQLPSLTVEISQTGTNQLLATLDATNWTSSKTNVLKVNTSGLISAVGLGTATVSATVDGVTCTSALITVTPQVLEHRYSFISDASDSVGGADGTVVTGTDGSTPTITNGLALPGNQKGGFGESGYVSLPGEILTNTTSLTVECWVTQNQGNGWAEIWDFANNNNQNFGLIPDRNNNTGITGVAFTPNGGEDDVNMSTPFPNGSEQYVVLTYNNITLTGNLYTNGDLVATTTFPNANYCPGSFAAPVQSQAGAIAGVGTAYNMLGNDIYGDWQFDGTVYEFRIWNGAVSPLYVEVSAAAGSSVVVTNLTPQSLAVNLTTTSMVGTETQQAAVVGNFAQASGVTVTGGVTTWTSSDTNILTVSSSGLITAQSGGSATVSATAGGVTATSASITVALTAPVITQQPASTNVIPGQSATFAVQAIGGDLSYQWSEGTKPIQGATNATLTLTNVTYGQSGGYSVLVTNVLGSTNSIAAMLGVEPAILEHRYSFVNDASDSVGGPAWKGTVVPPGNANGTAATISNGLFLAGGPNGGYSGYVSLPNGIVAGDTSVTVECWVQPNSVNNWAEIWDFGSSGSLNFALIQDSTPTTSPPLNMRVAFTPHGNEVDIQAPTYLPSGPEAYIAVTYDNSTLTGDLYTNGDLYASTVLPDSTYSPGSYGGANGTTDNAFGNDVYGDPQFGGTIFEVRIWNGVVSQRYIAASTILGPSVLATNLTPTSAAVMVATNSMPGESTQQATVTVELSETGTNELVATSDATNWTSSATNILTVNSSGLITAVGGGSATISATVAGITATSASITVPLVPPTITQEPAASANILAGGTLHTSVVNTGLEPYFYRWYFNTNSQPIGGATAATLTIPGVKSANAGSYTCVVSNAYGSVTSTPTVLTVVVPTPYQANLLALNPLAYWPLNEISGTVAYDMVGGYNGTYVGNVALMQPGVTNSSFGSPSYGVNFDGTTAYVDIPEGPFNITNAITTMAWVQLSAYPNFAGLFGHGDTSWRMSVNPSGEPGANDGNLGSADATSSTSMVDGNWHFVVYTFTDDLIQANNGVLYVDGARVAADSIAATPPGNSLDVWIGGAPDYGTARLLAANIAHAAIIPGALSAADVQALYAGQVIMEITRSASSIVLNWSSGTLLQAPTLLGPWTTNSAAVSPYTVPTTNGAEFYKVLVSP